MAKRVPKPRAKSAPVKATETLKIDGTFEQLIRKSLTVKKPAGGWPKPSK